MQGPTDRERPFLFIEVAPHQPAQFSPPQSCGDLQIEEVVPLPVLFDGLHEPLQLCVIEDGPGCRLFLGERHILCGILYDEMAVHRHIHCLMQDPVDPPHRGARQRTASGPALLFQLSIQLLDISGSDLADLLIAQIGNDLVPDIRPVALKGGGAHGGLRTLCQPDLQSFAQGHPAILCQFCPIIFLHAPVQLFQQFLLGPGG